MLRNSDHIHMLANTNLELPDVVGLIKSVKGFGLMSSDVISPILIQFLIAPHVEVYLSLLDEAAARFKAILNSGDNTNSLMVVTNVNPQKKGDNMYLYSTAGTNFYFGNNIGAITEFTISLSHEVGEDLACLTAESVITSKELGPTEDLTMFLSNSSSQEAYFTCTARIVEVVARNGWFCASCTQCGKELGNSPKAQPCDQCHDINATAGIRYKVEILVDDGDNCASFLVLDKEMKNLTKQDAATLLDDEVNRGLGNTLPQCIAALQGQTFIYHVHVTSDNFTDNTPIFTVSGMSEIPKKELSTLKGKEKVQVDYGEASTSTAATYT